MKHSRMYGAVASVALALTLGAWPIPLLRRQMLEGAAGELF
jgi:hypothetical protein